MRNKNLTSLIVLILLLLAFSIFIKAIGFTGSSPTTGQADYGNQTGNFTVQINTFTATQALDAIFYGMQRGAGLNVTANQTLGFNISAVSSNKSKIIRLINGSISYCHARTTANSCGGGAAPQGTPQPMRITILNISDGNYLQFRSLPNTAVNTLQK